MPVIRPPVLGDPSHDSWMNQVTQAINTQLITSVVGTSFSGGAEGAVGPTGADGVEGPHYAEVTLFTDPALSSPPTAPTATITWFTGVLSSVTAGWSQTPPTIDPTSTDTVYYSKIIFKDSIAPFATTTETGNTPVALYDFTNLPVSEENFTTVLKGKLDGIEALADVTDTANVTAAGALMDSELTAIASVKALDQGVATTDSPTFATVNTTTADFGDWTVTETGGSLYFATLGVNKMKLTAAGNLEITGTLTQSATIT